MPPIQPPAPPSLATTSPRREQTSSQEQVERAVDAVETLDRRGASLQSVQTVAPDAMAQALRADAFTGVKGALQGVPVLLKDNIELRGLPTTAGSLALGRNVSAQDAFLAHRLRAEGLVLFGKAAMTQWSAASPDALAGQSAFGRVRNAHDVTRSPSGSSSGSAVAVAAGIVPLAIGTETNGSITSPAAANGIVGFKPTVGLVSRSGVIPLSKTLDTPGPMATRVSDAASLLQVIAGEDARDDATRVGARRPSEFLKTLTPDALRGVRLGVVQGRYVGYDPGTDAVFERSLRWLERAGAVLIDDVDLRIESELDPAHLDTVLLHEFRDGIETYLRGLNDPDLPRSLEELIAFSRVTPAEGLGPEGQRWFEASAQRQELASPEHLRARGACREIIAAFGPLAAMRRHGVAALVAPTRGPAAPLVAPAPEARSSHVEFVSPAALARLPHLTVPMGESQGLPVGLSFVGPAWSDAKLLGYGFAFEQARNLDAP